LHAKFYAILETIISAGQSLSKLFSANVADSPETKSVLMMVAAAWHRLAQEHEDTERQDVEAAAHRG
jgi:hypothetical protein